VSGCTDEGTGSSGSQIKKVAKKTPAKKVAPVKAKQEEKKEPEFRYISDGRRDPFVPLTAIKKPLIDKPDEPATPLQRYDIPQFKLIGVIVGKGDPKAMVVAPDGKSYVLAKGTKIGKNNGVIVDITGDVILVKEKYYDFTGNVIENIQEITIPVREGI
jgi:type IV pilus assembly protein PilP